MQELMAKKKIMSMNSDHKNGEDNEEGDDQGLVLPGFRFHPTDEELLGFYLRRKVEKKPISIELIKQIDIYKYDPWDLPKVGNVGDKEWYFFCIRGRKYRNSVRPNRVTGSGFWKATGIDKPVYSAKEPHGCVGLKKSLVYYRGSAGKGTKTDWMMHEFRLSPSPNYKSTDSNFAKSNENGVNITDLEAEVWTLCRIFKRIPSYKKYNNINSNTIILPTNNSVREIRSHVMTEMKSPLSTSSISTPLDDSSSKTCSFETDYVDPFHRSKTLKPDDHERDTSAITDHGSWFTLGQDYNTNHVPQLDPSRHQDHHQHQHQAGVVLPNSGYPSFSTSPTAADLDFFTNESWDELRSVVQFAVDGHDQR